MADRLRSLRRIETVQGRMVRLAELRLAAADLACREGAADQMRLRDFLAGDGTLGAPLARAVQKSIQLVDRRLALAERDRDAEKASLDTLRRRQHVVADMAAAVERAARRAAEDRDLAATLEAWLARGAASQP